MSNNTSSMSTVRSVQEIWSHKITNVYRIMKHGLLQGLTAPLWWGCHYAWTHLYEPQSLLYPMVQVWQIYVCAPNQEKWFISQAHGSKFDGDVTILSPTFINFNLGAWSTNIFSVTASRLESQTATVKILYTCSRRGAWQSQWRPVERMWVWSRNVPSGTIQVLHGELLRWNSAL